MDLPNKMKQETINTLIRKSHEVKVNAFCKYSHFRVGAALLCDDGTIYTGCNVENAAYCSICAEMAAIAEAVSEGHTKFKAIVIASDLENEIIAPCGPCRQFLIEFGTDWVVIMTKPDMTYKQMTTGELLPLCFAEQSLNKMKNGTT